jgi:hypothetical protein
MSTPDKRHRLVPDVVTVHQCQFERVLQERFPSMNLTRWKLGKAVLNSLLIAGLSFIAFRHNADPTLTISVAVGGILAINGVEAAEIAAVREALVGGGSEGQDPDRPEN